MSKWLLYFLFKASEISQLIVHKIAVLSVAVDVSFPRKKTALSVYIVQYCASQVGVALLF